MAAHVLRSCGLKPSHYVGAEIPILGTNARWDSEGEYFVAEGDESDGTLINYHPEHAIVLNIEPEHLDFYKDLAAIDAVYAKLVGQTRGKDRLLRRRSRGDARLLLAPRRDQLRTTRKQTITGSSISRQKTSAPTFKVLRRGELLGAASLNIPGIHNAVNALAVIALACEIGLPFDKIAAALENFRGARRRFEICYETPRNLVVDDYGHHPTEISATIATARTGGLEACAGDVSTPPLYAHACLQGRIRQRLRPGRYGVCRRCLSGQRSADSRSVRPDDRRRYARPWTSPC